MKNKEKNNKGNKNDKIYKSYSFKQAGMLVQFVLCFFLLVFAILTIFYSEFMLACELTTGIVLLVMAYNNHKIYKRKSFTTAYVVIGIITLFFAIVDLLS